jgi:transcriptional regulator NrdR family protein
MKCVFCKSKTKVLDSREINDGSNVKRRRSCLKCKKVFYTQEALFEEEQPKVEPQELKASRAQRATGRSDMNDIWADLTDSNFTLRELGIKK